MDTDDPSEIGRALRDLVAKAAASLVLETTANLIEACPVDTGWARANFIPSVGEPAQGEGGEAAQQAGMAQVAAYKAGQGDLHIVNNVKYIDVLIAGSSQQAPAGWDLRAIDEAQQTVQAQYDALEIDVTVGPAGPDVSIRSK